MNIQLSDDAEKQSAHNASVLNLRLDQCDGIRCCHVVFFYARMSRLVSQHKGGQA
jgi:hypothetical protein